MRGIQKIPGFLLMSVSLSAFPFHIENGFLLSPAAAETAPLEEKAATVENIIIAEPSLTFKIKSLRVLGSPLSDADLAALFDSKSSQPLTDRLRQLTAEAIFIPEISVEKTGELRTILTYHNVKLEHVVYGTAAKASAQEANFTIKGTQGDILSGAYGKMQAEAFDIGLAAAVMSETRTDPTVQKTLLYKAFIVDGFTFANQKAHFAMSVKEISGHDVKARPLRQPGSKPISRDKPANEHPLSDYITMVWDGFDIGDAQISGLHTTARSDENPVTFMLDGLRINDLNEGRIAHADLDGLQLESENLNVKLKDLAIGGIDLRALSQTADEENSSGGEANTHRPSLFPAADSLKLSGLQVILFPGLTPRLPASSGEAPEKPKDERTSAAGFDASGFTVEQAETEHSTKNSGEPEQFSGSFKHLIVNLNQNLELSGPGKALANLGYSKFDMSGNVEFSVTPARELTISDFTLSGIDLGKIKASLIAEDVTNDVLSPDPAIAEMAFHQIILKHLDLRIDNFGLLSKVIAHLAEVQHKTIDETRDNYVTAAELIVPVLLGGAPQAKEIASALAKFIADPKTIHLIADAPAGLSLADLSLLQDPTTLLKKLKIEVKAAP